MNFYEDKNEDKYENKNPLPFYLLHYVNRSINKQNKKERLKISHDIMNKSLYSCNNPKNDRHIVERCEEWVYHNWNHANPNFSKSQRMENIFYDIITCIDILDGNEQNETKFVIRLTWFFSDNDDMINELKLLFQEHKTQIENIIITKNSIGYKLKTSKILAPAFNGFVCVVL